MFRRLKRAVQISPVEMLAYSHFKINRAQLRRKLPSPASLNPLGMREGGDTFESPSRCGTVANQLPSADSGRDKNAATANQLERARLGPVIHEKPPNMRSRWNE